MEINGVELVVNLYDVDFAERYENAMEKIDTEGLPATEKFSVRIRHECQNICNFFDNLFGAGTAKKIFKDKMDLNVALDYVDIVVAEATKQSEAMESRMNKYKARNGGANQ